MRPCSRPPNHAWTVRVGQPAAPTALSASPSSVLMSSATCTVRLSRSVEASKAAPTDVPPGSSALNSAPKLARATASDTSISSLLSSCARYCEVLSASVPLPVSASSRRRSATTPALQVSERRENSQA